MSKTKIEWAEHSWNPTRGCSRVSEGCRNCYAEAMGLLQPAAERLADTASRQDCKECDNTGRRRILKQQMVQAASGPKAIEIPFLGYCSCPLGQQMAGKRTVEPDQKGVQGVLV